ncbi:MAG TPA: class I SAM-dependent methyltransferase [Blastocatellia bacterium]|nr:class I SAM-dependent methyltransferase [Blastocatellia bacterium]
MSFEGRLFERTGLKKYEHCLKLIEANASIAPLWERVCLALYAGTGPSLARLFGVDASENWKRVDRIIAEVLAVTGLQPGEVARLLREYIRLRRGSVHHLPFDKACVHIYEQSFYPVVTHFTYALQPSATARLNFVKEVLESMTDEQAEVADLGCGSGVILNEILTLKQSWTGYGLDISHASINYARKLAAHKGVAERAEFMTGDASMLPYADQSLSLVIASEVIEHLPHPELIVKEIARVLKPGGKLILTMPLESHTPAHLHALRSAQDLRALCEDAGLRVRRLEPRWHLGFGDDPKHVFALAEARASGEAFTGELAGTNVIRSFPSAYPEPEIA